MNRRTFVASGGCGLATILSGCVTGTPLSPDVSASETRTYDADEGESLRVTNWNGPVTVDGTDEGALEVDVEKEGGTQASLDATTVAVNESGGEFHVRTTYDESAADERADVSLAVQCPETLRVEEVVTTNGAVDVSGVSGDAALESTNGSITATDVDGTVSLATTNGSITAARIGGLAGATTSNGSVDVEVPAIADETTVQTQNGGIDVALDPGLNAAVTATTTNGSVEVEGLDFSSSESSETEFSGTLGDGEKALAIETQNAGIEIEPL